MFELDSDDRHAIAALESARETSVPTRLLREAAILVPCAVIFYFAVAWGDGAALWIGPGLYAGYRIYLSFVDLARDRRIGEILRAFEDGQLGPASGASVAPERTDEPAGAAREDAARRVPSHPHMRSHPRSHGDGHVHEHPHDHDHDHHHGHHHVHSDECAHGPSHALWAAESGDAEDTDDARAGPVELRLPRGRRGRREEDLEPEELIAECFAAASAETALASEHYRVAAKRFRAGKVPRGCAHAFAAFGHLQEARRAARAAATIHADRAGT